MPVTKNGAQRASRHRPVLVIAFGLALAVLVTASPVTASAATAPWYSVETYYLKLLNCTRTGGWVRSDGSCAGYGSGRYSKYVAPIKLHYYVSPLVARPYAKKLAVYNRCTHYLWGTSPVSRLRAAGYNYPTWGENIGCRDGYSNTYQAVLASHRVFQAEKSTNGGHWQNIKNARFKYVGIGVWRYSGRVRLVTDFVGY